MDKEDITSYFEALKAEPIAKLIAVGFTEEQAKVLLEVIQAKALTGGLF